MGANQGKMSTFNLAPYPRLNFNHYFSPLKGRQYTEASYICRTPQVVGISQSGRRPNQATRVRVTLHRRHSTFSIPLPAPN